MTKEKPDAKWTETNLTEMWAFLEIFMQVPKYSIAWGSSTFFGIPGLSEIMLCERFERFCKYFHVNDTTNNQARRQPGHDKLCHIRPILDTVLEKCFNKNLFHQNWSKNNEINIQFYKPQVNIYILCSQPFWCCSIHHGNKHQYRDINRVVNQQYSWLVDKGLWNNLYNITLILISCHSEFHIN